MILCFEREEKTKYNEIFKKCFSVCIIYFNKNHFILIYLYGNTQPKKNSNVCEYNIFLRVYISKEAL